jgi:hypothetical protein
MEAEMIAKRKEQGGKTGVHWTPHSRKNTSDDHRRHKENENKIMPRIIAVVTIHAPQRRNENR